MHRTYIASAVLIATATISSMRIIGQTPGQIPLRIEQPRVVNGRVTVELVNVGTRTIVAWGVTAQVKYADGTSRGHEVMTDGFEQSVRQYPNNPVLPPGGRYVLAFATGVANVTDVVTVASAATLVIFDDDTAMGDERRLERLFADRAVNERVLQQLETVLESAVKRSADPLSALHDAASQLAAIESAEVRRSPAFTEFDRKIAFALRSGQADAASAGPRLQQLRQEATSLRSVAVAHAQRRF
jgi:hypothetical protein